jgi:hypothetical protein
VHTQAAWWQNPSPLDDEEDGHLKESKIHREAGTAKGDEKAKTFDEGWVLSCSPWIFRKDPC